MGAPDLLQHLRDVGLVLNVLSGDRLHVAPREALTDELREAIRIERDALVSSLNSEARQAPQSRTPLMTQEQLEACHRGGWDDAEIEAFRTREARFTRMGRTDAQDLAERLTLRDRDGDDRRMCIECLALDERGQCQAAALGKIVGAARRFVPIQTILQRCEAFAPSCLHSTI